MTWPKSCAFGLRTIILNGTLNRKEDLNLSVNGVLQLTAAEVRRLAAEAGGLLPVNATVMDDDAIFDDTVFTRSVR